MKICRVVIPFRDKVTDEFHKENDRIILSDERIAEIRTVNTNIVCVIGDAPDESEEADESKEEGESKEEDAPKEKQRKKKNE